MQMSRSNPWVSKMRQFRYEDSNIHIRRLPSKGNYECFVYSM
jgi:hypothetical protein